MFQFLKSILGLRLDKYDMRLKASDDLLQITFQDIKSGDLCSFLKEFAVNLSRIAEDRFQFHYHDVPIRYSVDEIYQSFETAQAEFTVMIQLDFIEFDRIYIENVQLSLENYENTRNVEFCFNSKDVKIEKISGFSDEEVFLKSEEHLCKIQSDYNVEILYGGLDTAVIEEAGAWYIHYLQKSNHQPWGKGNYD